MALWEGLGAPCDLAARIFSAGQHVSQQLEPSLIPPHGLGVCSAHAQLQELLAARIFSAGQHLFQHPEPSLMPPQGLGV